VIEGHEVTVLEVLPHGRRPTPATEGQPFRYLPVTLESVELLTERIASTPENDILIIDLPPLCAAAATKILPALAVAIMPLHPAPLDLAVARGFLEELDQVLPGWKSSPQGWVLHVDIGQSVRGSLSLIDELVQGWRLKSLPPYVLPATFRWLSRPELRALMSAAQLSGSLAASARILALMTMQIMNGAAEELLLPGAMEERMPGELLRHYRGEDRSMHEKMLGLAADLAEINLGGGPRPIDLLGAPILHQWQEEPFRGTLLSGIVGNHPRFGTGNSVRTSQAVIINERAGWARTVSRFYRLGRKACPEPKPAEPQA
jgi:hypothetical protein